jgi:hypothetical protein
VSGERIHHQFRDEFISSVIVVSGRANLFKVSDQRRGSCETNRRVDRGSIAISSLMNATD